MSGSEEEGVESAPAVTAEPKRAKKRGAKRAKKRREASAAAADAERSVAERSVAERSVAERSVAHEKAADEKAGDEKAADEKAGDEKAGDETAADEKAADEKAAGGPASDEPVPDEPAEGAADDRQVARAAEPASPRFGDPASEGPGARRVRRIRGGILTGLGFGATFLLMANQGQIPHGPLLGILTMLVGTAGLLDLLGLWTEGGAARIDLRKTALFALEGEPIWMSPVVTVPAALAVLLGGGILGGYDNLPYMVVLAGVLLLVSGLRRPYLLLIATATLLLLPFLGVYGLWDPWETHYGEVAREMLARDDWISLWWAQEDWFWSKPILIFWIEALSMGAFGVDFLPDANPAHPEWAVRFPHFLLVLGALSAIYGLVAARFSKRAGLIAGVVLCTMPHFFFLAHQSITDMPFVSNMTIAICLLGLAVTIPPDAKIARYRLGPITLSARTALIAGITLIVLPQVLYLFSRNVTLVTDGGAPFGWHGDRFVSGSGHNYGIPGNSVGRNETPFVNGPGAQPVSQGILWLLAYLGLLWILRKEDRGQTLAMFGFYVFCGLAFMAKGIPGFALPGLVALFWLIATRRWDLLGGGHLRVGQGILTVLTVGLPWYVAMYIRHGRPFTDRLLIHDHINRLTAGVHGDTGSIEYFVEQMGYGLFPWIGLAPIALAMWFGSRPGAGAPTGAPTDAQTARRQVVMMVALWLAAAFTLFSAMTTKFHHYIFPTVPAAAILVGLGVDRLLSDPEPARRGRRLLATALAVVAPIPAIVGVAGLWGDVRGVIPEGAEDTADWVLAHPWSAGTAWGLVLAGVALLAGAAYLMGFGLEGRARTWSRGALTTGLVAGAPVVAMVGRDLSWVTDARPQGYERLIHLFVYNYGRPWPEHFDFRPILTGFAVIATAAVLLAAIKPLRDVATRAFIGVALAFCVWSLDVYMIDLSPHWGQRELVQRYYDARESDDEVLIAYQMNWKGENFYTGNRVHVFVQLDNRALGEWVSAHPGQTVFVMLERSRLSNLRGVLRGAEVEELTDDRLCNKFILIRAALPGRE